jgi:hypothetical protein
MRIKLLNVDQRVAKTENALQQLANVAALTYQGRSPGSAGVAVAV